jgi:hypothetical protein
MKSRLFLRMFCVGAALLIPASGLAVLGVGNGTAGAATTTLSFGSPSTLNFGSLGDLTFAGQKAKETGTTGKYIIPKTTSIPIDTTDSSQLVLTTALTIRVIHTGSTITGVKFEKITQLLLKIGTKKCEILTIPALIFSATDGKWKAEGSSLSGVTVKSTTCSTHVSIQNDINSSDLTGSLTLSLT